MEQQRQSSSIRLFPHRSIVYKIGFIAIILSFLLYAFTFVSSNWIEVNHDNGDEYSQGLWDSCEPNCDGGKNILTAVRTMACVCVAGYLLTIIVSFFDNCRLVSPEFHSRKVDWLALFTGTIGLVMDLVFIMLYFIRLEDSTLGIGCLINGAAVVILFTAGTMIACNNRNPQAARGRVLSTQPMLTIHYNADQGQGRPHPSAPQLPPESYPQRQQNEPFLPQHQQWYPHPNTAPPPYNLPPSYPGDKQDHAAQF